MKKILLFGAMLLSVGTFAQKVNSINVGGIVYNDDMGKASNVGLEVGLTFQNFHVDYNTNFANGKDMDYDYDSYEEPKPRRLAQTINVGYVFQTKVVNLMPFVGYHSKGEIFVGEDDDDKKITYMIPHLPKYNLGLNLAFNTNVGVSPYIGYGLSDGLKFGLNFKY